MQSRLPCRGNISDSWPYPTTKFLRAHLCLLFFMKWIGSFSKKETSLCRLRSYPHPALSPQGARVVRFFASLRMTMTGGGAERDPGGAEDGTPESAGLRRGSRLSTSGWLGGRTRSIGNGCPGDAATGPLPLSSLPIFKTSYHVIVHHAGRLHVRVTDRRADELEAALLQVLGQGVGLRRGRPDGFSSHPIAVAHCPVAREAPDVPIETAVLLLHVEKPPRVGDGRFDFQAITDDTRVSHQACNVSLAESRHFPHIEVLECLPEIVALAQDGNPAQPRLKALQGQHLKDLPIVMDRHAPLLVVILAVQRVLPAPPAPGLTGNTFHEHESIGLSGPSSISTQPSNLVPIPLTFTHQCDSGSCSTSTQQ